MSDKMPQTLPETEGPPYRCRNCKSHLLMFDGFYYVCSRLVKDPTTGKLGCGRQFVRNVYERKEVDS